MKNQGLGGIPAPYDYINVYNSIFAPSTVHITNTGLARYFQRYLIQKVFSVFKFENIPDSWAVDYFLYSLFCFGYVAIIETDKFGVIPQHCSLMGRDVFYRPTNAVIGNPLLKGIKQPRIGKECALIKMQPDYCGCWDIITYYADLLALASESAGVNLLNSKLAYVFATDSKAGAETFKKFYDQIASGEPAAVLDKSLFNEDGKPNWLLFNQNVKNTYIVSDILQDMAKIDSRFNTEIGIPNVNIAKESGVAAVEVEANNIDTRSKADLWLETMRKGLDDANKLFGLNLKCDLRFIKGGYDGDTINYGNI